jgi:hypothetical protein
MRRLAFALWLVLMPAALGAETVRLQSGAHEGFSRLVMEFDTPVPWRMVRSDTGYRLAFDRPGLRFDLARVFERIDQDRLASVWADPATGELVLGIGCACHAMPFELRDRVLVIDIRDGPAPPGSSFELAGDGRAMPPLAGRAPVRPPPRPAALPSARPPVPVPALAAADAATGGMRAAAGYDWLADALGAPPQQAAAPGLPAAPQPAPPPAIAAGPGLAALRDDLLREIGAEAARGTIELATDLPKPNQAAAAPPDTQAQVRIGGTGLPVDPASATRPAHSLTADGQRCLPDAAVDVGAWGAETPVAETLSLRTAALYGEFDRVDPEAAGAAVRYFLHLGFGAEARLLMQTLPIDAPEVPLWTALADIVDGKGGAPGPLAGMEVCDGAVALWALLARGDLRPGDAVQAGAVLRAFSALPLHLRRHLGPTLAARFLARGETATVRAIRDAILRPGGDPGPAVRLMEAELQGAVTGTPDPAALAPLQAAPGTTAAAATIATIHAIVAGGGAVDLAMLTATEALLREYKGAAEETGLRHALALALASQGDYDQAFAHLPGDGAGRADLWAMLAARGPDAAVLTHAVPAGPAQGLPPGAARAMAGRLVDLGFAEAALAWLGAETDTDEGDTRQLAARAELLRGDARAALGQLAGLAGAGAADLRNTARLQLATPEPLAQLRADPEAPAPLRDRAVWLARDWPVLAAEGPDPWREAAALANAAPPDPALPPLARARALLDESAAARATLARLMEAAAPVPEPQPGTGS